MSAVLNNRLDPSLIGPDEIRKLVSAFARSGHMVLIDEAGNQTEIPEVFFHHLERLIRLMSEKRTLIMMPEDEAFTTQAAANYLGTSRQHLVNLLENGEIPFHRIGTHRRVIFKDLLSYEKSRDMKRREALDRLAKQVDEAGLYNSDYTGDP